MTVNEVQRHIEHQRRVDEDNRRNREEAERERGTGTRRIKEGTVPIILQYKPVTRILHARINRLQEYEQ